MRKRRWKLWSEPSKADWENNKSHMQKQFKPVYLARAFLHHGKLLLWRKKRFVWM